MSDLISKGMIAALLLSLSSFAAVVMADDDDELYYIVGGAAPVGGPASNRDSTIRWDQGGKWDSDLACGKFDILQSVMNQLNGDTGAFNRLMDQVIDAASGLVASLPALVLQRLNPALYDLLQNGILQGSEEFHLAEVNCEKMAERISTTIEGKEWKDLSKGRFWVEASQGTLDDILTVEDEAETFGMDNGVPWVGGVSRGGADQEPIELSRDTTMAGYNLLLQRDPASTRGSCGDAAICTVWATPEAAADWVVNVLGEKEVRTCQGCNNIATQAGMGLLKRYETTRDDIQTLMLTVVNSSADPDAAALEEISGGNGLRITRTVIESIRNESAREAIVLRLSSEMALARTVDQALLARRALLAGRKEPNIASAFVATAGIQETVNELNDEITNLLFEMEIRTKLASNTTTTLLRRQQGRRSLPVVEEETPRRLEDGGVPD